MKKLTMHTSRTYDILMEDGLLTSAAERIAEMLPPGDGRKCCVVCDKTVYRLYGKSSKPLQEGLIAAGYEVGYYAFPPGEESKTLDTVADICAFMAENHFTREDFIIALGGGVCGDIAGFAASIYMRGVPYVQIPTTLLAMADSSVGGKTGVNTEAGKNMIGSFWQPHRVLIDPKVLETLEAMGCGNAIAQQRGKLGVVPDNMDCDYYDWCDGKRMGILWQGEYMVQYSWSEYTAGVLERMNKN